MARKRSKLDLMITAIHEAGHAVAAYRLGYTLTSVTMGPRRAQALTAGG
jgi:ATP-dependent Zn protease